MFHTDEILTGEIASQWIDQHTEYMANGNQYEMINNLKSPNGEYYMVVIPQEYGQEYTVIDTAGTELTFDDLMVVPMACDTVIYAIQGFGIAEMYFMYNDVRFDSGIDVMTGFCSP